MNAHQGVRFYESPPREQFPVKGSAARQQDIDYLRAFTFNEAAYLGNVQTQISTGASMRLPTVIDANEYERFLHDDRHIVERRITLAELGSSEFDHQDEEVEELFESFCRECAACFYSMIQAPFCLSLVMEVAPYFRVFLDNIFTLTSSKSYLEHLKAFCLVYGDKIGPRIDVILNALVVNNVPETMYVFISKKLITGNDLFAACIRYKTLKCMKTLFDEQVKTGLPIDKYDYIYNGDRSTYVYLLLASEPATNEDDEVFQKALYDDLRKTRSLDVLYVDDKLQNCLHKAIIASNLELTYYILATFSSKQDRVSLCSQRDTHGKTPLHYLVDKIEMYPFKQDKEYKRRVKAEISKGTAREEDVHYKMRKQREREEEVLLNVMGDIINIYDLTRDGSPDPEGVFASLAAKHYDSSDKADETMYLVLNAKSLVARIDYMGYGTGRKLPEVVNGPPSFEDFGEDL